MARRRHLLLGSISPSEVLSKILGPSLVVQTLGLLLAFLAQIVIARAINAAHFGTYSLVMAVASGAAILARFGWDSTVMRFGGPLVASQDLARLRSLISSATAAVSRTSAVAVLLIVGAGSVAAILDISEVSLGGLLLGAAMIPVVAQAGIRQAALLAAGRVWAALAPEYVLRPLLLLGGAIVMLTLLIAEAEIALLVALVASSIALLAGLVLLRPLCGATAESTAIEHEHKTWASNARSTVLFNGSFQLLAYGDILVAGLVLPAASVGYYAAARALSMMGTFVLVAMQSAIGPTIAAALRRQDTSAVARISVGIARLAAVFAAAYGLCLAALGRPILGLFGHDFEAGYPALIALSIAQVTNAAAGPLGSVVTMSGIQREASRIYAVAAAVLIASAICLSSILSALGVAIAVILSTLTWTILLNRLVATKVEVSTWAFSRGAGIGKDNVA